MVRRCIQRAVRAALEPLESRLLLSLVPVYNLQIEAPANQAAGGDDVAHGQGIEIMANITDAPHFIEVVWNIDGGFGGANGHSSGAYVHSGESFARSVDLQIPGRGFDYRFERKYRSGVTYDSPLGHNWDFNYNQHLVEVTAANIGSISPGFGTLAVGDVIRVDGGMRADIYKKNPDGSYQPLAGYYTRLVKRPDGTFFERDSHGNVAEYSTLDVNSVAHLGSLIDAMDNTMSFQYDPQGKLTTVIDTLGRPITYSYVGTRLDMVQDFAGRSIRFTYDGNGDLTNVRSPVVSGTPNGNDFPTGKTTRYTYSSGFGDPRLNHNLLSVTAPNEVATAGAPRIVYTYTTAGADLDRVQNQTIGGANGANFPSGGMLVYNYTPLPPPPPNDLITPAIRVRVTDRNGNQTDYSSNQLGNIVIRTDFTNRNMRPGEGDYTTNYEYNADSEMLRTILPRGNRVEYTYDSGNPDRFQQGNLTQMLRLPAGLGGDQNQLRTTYTYEPVYNQVRTMVQARGNDAGYVPQNGGANSPARYTTTFTYDYQEGTDFAALGNELGITPAQAAARLAAAGVPMGLGDVNGDGITSQLQGNLIRRQDPSANLLPGSNQAAVEGGTVQPIVETYVYNNFGQITRMTDPEANVTRYTYYSGADPNGDGIIDNPSAASRTGGYLRETVVDDASAPIRNSGTNPPPAGLRTRYFYDSVGNMTRQIDGRGIATEYTYNQLNQVVQIKHAASIDANGPKSTEPLPLVPFSYLERFTYDANDNLVRHQIEDRRNTSLVNPPISPPVGDLNGDQYVDDIDLATLLANHGILVGATLAQGDIDGDGDVDDNDLNLLLGNFGFVPPSSFFDVFYEVDLLDHRIEMRQEVSHSEIITTRYRYDPNGNLRLTIHPEGNATHALYDERDLLLSMTGGQVGPPELPINMGPTDPANFNIRGGIPSTYMYHYDGNGNLIERVDASDTDLSAANNSDILGAGDRTRYMYDGYDRRVSIIDSVGNQTVYQYDPMSRLVRASQFGPTGGASPTSDGPDILPSPVSSNGVIQSANLINSNLLGASEYRYDELNRLFQVDGTLFVNTIPLMRPADVADGAASLGKGNLTPGDTAAIPGVAQVMLGRVSQRYEYDRNSRRTFVVEDDTDTARIFYDGAGRVIRTLDPQGNNVRYAYDRNSNLIETQETDVSQVGGIPDEVFLTTYFYDSLNRVQRQVDNIGRSVEYRYDSRNNLVATSDASGPLTGGTIGRRAFAGGALTVNNTNGPGNVTRYTYDGMSRMIRSETIMSVSGQGDGLRIGALIDGFKTNAPPADPAQGGNDGIVRSGWIYDRNSNLAATLDDQGNVTVYTYDNLDRRVTATDGLVVTTAPLNKNKILGPRNVVTPTPSTINNPQVIPPPLIDQQLAATQARLNAVLPLFPPLANVIQDNPPTTTVYGYCPDDNILILEDENDTETFTRYDAVNRPFATRVFRSGQADSHAGDPAFAPNPALDLSNPTGPLFPVLGTTKQDYQYDGLSRLTRATDNNDPLLNTDDSILTFAYDSLSRQIEETQKIGPAPALPVDQGWRAENLASELIYPNARQLDYTYDVLDRLQTVRDTGAPLPIADYDYIGRDRVLQQLTPINNTRMTHMNDTGNADVGYDGARRPVLTRHLRNAGNTLMAGTQNQYDRADNIVHQLKMHDPINSEITQYDSGYRTRQFQRTGGIIPQHQNWQLDGVGNWRQVDAQLRQHSSQNEITMAGATIIRSDDNSNTSSDGTFTFQFDYRNRLVNVIRQAGNLQTATYAYDAMDRRISKVVTNSGPLNGTTFFLYRSSDTLEGAVIDINGQQHQLVIEERNGAGVLTQQYVSWKQTDQDGRLGSFLVIDRNLNGNATANDPGDQRLFYLELDSLDRQSLFGLADINARVVEGYLYDQYGRTTVFQAGPNGFVDWGGDDIIQIGGTSALANPYMFQGQRLDPETRLYCYGDRYLHTELGRFLTSEKPADIKGADLEKALARVRARDEAGNCGAATMFRIGHEVIVDFLEGDPDQPIIVGSVYNAEVVPWLWFANSYCVSKVADGGFGTRVYRYEMENTLISSWSISGHGGDGGSRPMESLSLNFTMRPNPSPYLSDWEQRHETIILASVVRPGRQPELAYAKEFWEWLAGQLMSVRKSPPNPGGGGHLAYAKEFWEWLAGQLMSVKKTPPSPGGGAPSQLAYAKEFWEYVAGWLI